jgi:hypothetical protein
VVEQEHRHPVGLGLELADVGFVQSGGRLPVDAPGLVASDVRADLCRFQAGAEPARVVLAVGGRDRLAAGADVDVARRAVRP